MSASRSSVMRRSPDKLRRRHPPFNRSQRAIGWINGVLVDQDRFNLPVADREVRNLVANFDEVSIVARVEIAATICRAASCELCQSARKGMADYELGLS